MTLAALFLLACLGYLVQPLRNGPNPVDEGLLVSVLDALANGQRLHRDVLDLYGPAHWAAQRWHYAAWGQRLIGARIYLLFLKTAGLALSALLVFRLAGLRYALGCTLWLTLLLGVPWQLLQAPYPFLQAWVLALLVYYLLLCQRPEPRTGAATTGAALLAGGLTGIAIATKLNAGAFLLAGGLFVQAFGLTDRQNVRRPQTALGPTSGRALGMAALLAFGTTFALATGRHLNVWFVLYLWCPLGLLLGWVGVGVARGDLVLTPVPALRFGASALATTALIFLWAFGAGDALDYLATSLRIIGTLDYTAPLPPIGQPGPFVGFNEFYWPQLIWVAALLLAVVAFRARREHAVASVRALAGLWALCSCHFFVLYSRPDESHIYQAMLPAVPALFVCAWQLARGLRPPARRAFELSLAGLVLAGMATLWVPPSLRVLGVRPSPWHSPKLAAIDFQPRHNPYVVPAFFHDQQQVDERTNAAAAWLDAEAADRDRLMTLTRDELLPLNANLRPAGGRYRYLFYLLKNGFIDRKGFEALAPAGFLAGFLTSPPEWIMDEPFRSPILDLLPELELVLAARYRIARRFGHVILYRRIK